ncbi:MAG: hypothetical protein K0U41_07360, partial [Gammaproteobacteria bacterium]|nr:hypothetical protein [Gammaproteobacteria bacterium]
GTSYLFVAGLYDSGVSVFSVAASGLLRHVDGVNDRENPGTYNLRLTSSVTVTDVNGTSYLFVAGEEDDGISVFMVAADGSLSYVGGVDDGDGNYKLDGAWSLTTLKVAENNYLFVGGYVDDGVSVFRVTAEGLLSHAYSVGDTDNVLYQLDGVISVTTAKINGANYLFVAGDADDGISVFSVMANGSLLHTNSIDDNDDGSYQLGGATPVSVVNIDGANYLYVGGVNDEGISAFSILANGSLAHLANYPGDSHNAYKLGKVRVMKVTEIAGISYLFVGGFDAGVNVFSIAANGYLNHVDDVYDIEGEYMLNYPVSITTADINGTIYLFVGGLFDNRISVFNVAVNGSLSYVTRINDGDNNAYRFQGTVSMVVSELGGVSYLFAAGFHDNGVSVFSIAANGHLNYVTSVDSTSGAKLQGARSVITHVIGGVTYLFVASFLDDGVSMFRVAANGNLSYVDSIDDGDDLAYELDGAVSMDIVKIGDASYLFVAGYEDDGISVFSIAADSSLSHLTSISDDEDPAYTLDAIRFLTVAAIEGTNYLFASGFFDNGASVFKFNFAGNSKNN